MDTTPLIALAPPLEARFLEPKGFRWGHFTARDGASTLGGRLAGLFLAATCLHRRRRHQRGRGAGAARGGPHVEELGAPRPQRSERGDRGNDRNQDRAPREGGDTRPPRQGRDRGDRRPNAQANRLGTPSALKHASGPQESGFNSALAEKLAALKEQMG